MTCPFVLIDGSGFIFRAFHALPPLTRSDGTPVGAVYGFCTMIMKLMDQAPPEGWRMAVVFDVSRKTFRHTLYPSYKANRADLPEELIPQFPLIREACQAFGLPVLEAPGYEADDLIATYAHQAAQEGEQVCIVSSDKDLMQLVDGSVYMMDPLKNKRIGPEEVREKFGVPPHQVVDVQALAGDASDNVPGVPGIGPKTAAHLIQTFGTLENLLSRTHEIPQPKRRQALEEHQEAARTSKELVTLVRNAPMPYPLQEILPVTRSQSLDREALRGFLQHQGFATLAHRASSDTHSPRIPLETPVSLKTNGVEAVSLPPPSSYRLLKTIEELKNFSQEAHGRKFLAFYTDVAPDPLPHHRPRLLGMALSHTPREAVYIPFQEEPITTEASPSLFPERFPSESAPLAGFSSHAIEEHLGVLFRDPSLLKVGHHVKNELRVLDLFPLMPNSLSDIMVMSYGLEGTSRSHALRDLANRYLGEQEDFSHPSLCDKGAFSPNALLATLHADWIGRVFPLLDQRLYQERGIALYERIDRPLIHILADMEKTGIQVDEQVLKKLGAEFSQDMAHLEARIHQLAGYPFNIGSPKQLGEILFEKKGIPGGKKTKTGAYVTDGDTLEKIAEYDHTGLVHAVLEWRSLAKLVSTYIEGLTQAIHPQTRRIHTTYSLTHTATGRLASSHPNLQNIPIRTEKGRQVRQAFVASKGHCFISLDYSQIELRLLAEMANVPPLAEAFQRGEDIHTTTALRLFHPQEGSLTELRRRAKAVNFGILYGISAFGLAKQLNISAGEASQIIQAYFKAYPGIQDYMNDQKETAKTYGYVTTLWGRKCFISGIHDRKASLRSFAERQAMNAPLQGSNADLIKRAMGEIFRHLKEYTPSARLILQIHDELILECPEQEASELLSVVKGIMERSACLTKIPVQVEGYIGYSWGQMESSVQ